MILFLGSSSGAAHSAVGAFALHIVMKSELSSVASPSVASTQLHMPHDGMCRARRRSEDVRHSVVPNWEWAVSLATLFRGDPPAIVWAGAAQANFRRIVAEGSRSAKRCAKCNAIL